MKNLFLSAIFVVASVLSFATGTWVKISSDPAKPEVTLNSSNINTTVFNVSISGFWKSSVETSNGEAWLIDLGNNIRNLEKGAPDLPYISTSLIIPDNSEMDIKIVSSEYRDYENVLIAPSKGNLYRDVDPNTVPYEYGKVYQRNNFYPGSLVKLNSPYIIRDFRGQAVWIMPFQYNPVTKVLRVFYNIKVKVFEKGNAVVNSFNRVKPLNKVDVQFKEIYKRQFLNYSSAFAKYDPVDEHGNMLIISYGDFMDEMQPFVDWKTKSGTAVEVVDVASIGNNSAAIKQYVADYYNNKGLTFLLLVGDAAQVKSSYSNGDSDNDYTYVVGNDHYPDLFCGRFSSETEEHVITQVERTLDYEMNPNVVDTAWYTKALGIASDQGPGDDNEFDYQHIRNIQNNKLIPFTYNYGYELFDGNQGGNDEPGDPSPADVKDVINSGASIINYTGHGSTTSWGTSGFSNANISALNNAGKLPFIFSVACVNGNFVGNTCFAETWLRSEDAAGNPIGAIATIMSTINQSWNPPMAGQDAMDDILAELVPNNIKRTFGGIAMNGCMQMNDDYGSQSEKITDTWTIFGDPSLVIRTAVPEPLEANYPSVILVGQTSFSVSCSYDGAIATLSRDGVMMGSAIVENGVALINFDEPVSLPGTAELVITGFNKLPLMVNIPVNAGSGPFVVYDNSSVDDTTTGNANGIFDYNEEAYLNVAVKNVGSEATSSVSAIISTADEFVTLIDSTEDFGAVDIDEVKLKDNAFKVAVSPLTPNQHSISFVLTVVFDGDTSVSYFNKNVLAPELSYVDYSIDDSENGNGNGKLDPGETVMMTVSLTNGGASKAFNVNTELSAGTDWVSITQPEMGCGDVNFGDTASVVFEVSADGDTPPGFIADFNLNITADFGISANGQFNTVIGQKPVIIIKLGSNGASADSIAKVLNVLSVASDIVTEVPDNLNLYQCAFVTLGVYSNNYVLQTAEGQKLADFLDGGGRLYMEGGDTWYYNEATPVHPYFHINGTADGSGDFEKIVGDADSFMKDFIFTYDGANNWMDHIEAEGQAFVLLNNESSGGGYNGPAVIAYENDTYKTIGSVCEFGGLHAGGPSGTGGNQAGYMALMLDFFGVNFTWTGINKNIDHEINGVKVYPNPVKDILNIEIDEKLADNANITIYNMQGRVVNSVNLNNSHFAWNISSDKMNTGVYFYRVVNGNKSVTGKLIFTR